MSDQAKTVVSGKGKGADKGQAELLKLISGQAQAVLGHPQIRNKTPKGVASKVARNLNRMDTPPPVGAGMPYWTGADVQGYLAKNCPGFDWATGLTS